MKTLLYAFQPYGGNVTNISESVLKLLPFRDVEKMVLPVAFDKKVFQDLVARQPKYIIGLGQYPRGEMVRIERRAQNLYGAKKLKNYRPIMPGKPRYRSLNLLLKPNKHSRLSYDAGKYVCNFSMYMLADLCSKHNIQYAFFHIPKGMNKNIAAQSIAKMLHSKFA
jgi:pyrrolidone-carboxylate peptidase